MPKTGCVIELMKTIDVASWRMQTHASCELGD